MIYFIDESGNSGDLLFYENNLNFNNQKYFSLACIGIPRDNLKEFENEILELKKEYKINASELKATAIYKKKARFIQDTFRCIEKNKGKILIEFVDKKAQVIINIVNTLLFPPYYMQDNESNHIMKKIAINFLYDVLPNDFLIKFSSASRTPTEESLIELFNELIHVFKNINNEMSLALIDAVKESQDDFELMKKEKLLRPAYTYFLPLGDNNKRGENIAILPNINCFTNICARINMMHKGSLQNISIIHDQQDQFDDILFENLRNLPNLPNINNLDNNVDYSFNELFNFEFKNSKNSIGIQVADLFAGFSIKVLDEIINSDILTDINKKYAYDTIQDIQSLNNKEKGQGINIVSTKLIQERIFMSIQKSYYNF